MRPIKQLPPAVVNKIAAGEVIERPASLVKELLENSVDAGATRIEVAIEKGGLDLVRITDDGHGIGRDQLELAVTSHATSKIENADDLFRVATLGFRGEALASIAEVSQMVLRSRSADDASGYELRINGGQREPVVPVSCRPGTMIEVSHLFFNTPVRRKFLRTTQTEMGHIGESFARVALARPEIHLSLTHNGKTSHNLPATENWADRVESFFGSEIGESLIPIQSRDGPISISGFVVDPSHSRGNNRMQYLFLNGRFIRDRALQHALSEAYRGLLMTGRYPMAFLRLEMPPELVDVNVHPAKLEVRFQEGSRLYSQLLGALRSKFLSSDLTARAQLSDRPEGQTVAGQTMAGQTMAGQTMAGQTMAGQAARQSAVAPWAAEMNAPHQSTIGLQVEKQSRDWTAGPAAQTTAADPLADQGLRPGFGRERSDGSAPHPPQPLPENFAATRLDQEYPLARSPLVRALQIHNRYLITESDEGVVVIDQHALHERIIYEQLREKVLAGKLETQQLLVPEPVPLAPAEAARIIQSADVLKKIGIDVQDFGGGTVLVSAYPAMLANHNPAEMLRSVVDILIAETKQIEARDIVDELLHMISCKAAIKAGDQLSDEEITALLEHREYCQDAHHCPHGRPTALVFSREELDKRFKRI